MVQTTYELEDGTELLIEATEVDPAEPSVGIFHDSVMSWKITHLDGSELTPEESAFVDAETERAIDEAIRRAL